MNIREILGSVGTGINNLGSGLAEAQGDPVFNLGLGLLAAGGRRPGQRVSFGQGLLEAGNYMNQKQADFQKLEANRQALAQAKQQRAAQQDLIGLLNRPAAASVPAAIRRPGAIQDEQRQMMGLLAQANPEAYTSGLLTSMFTPANELPSDVRTAQFLAQNPQLMDTFQQMKGNNPDLSTLVDLLTIRAMDQDFEVTEGEQDALRRAEDRTARELLQGGLKVLESEIEYADIGGSHGPSLFGLTNLNLSGMSEAVAPGAVPGAKERGEAQGNLEKNLADFRNIAAPEGSTNFALQQSAEAQASMEQLPAVNVNVVKGRLQNILFSYQQLTDEEFTERFGVSREQIASAIEKAENRFASQNPGTARRRGRGQMGRPDVGRVISDEELGDFE